MHSKTYRSVKEKAPAEAVDIATAVAFLKEHTRAKFDETVEIHIKLGVDPSKSDQMVRGSANLPHGAPKQKDIAVFASSADKQAAAKQAGAKIVGGEELIADIQAKGDLAADISIATPDMMAKVAKIGKILGPKGLMPNPKTGTVTEDPAAAVKELAGGKLSFKMDQLGNIHEAVAKLSWEAEKIADNVRALIDAVQSARPQAHKGKLIGTITIKSTMSPGIRMSRE